jgi:hypothetical protein
MPNSNTCQEHREREWLDNVVIRSQIEALHDISFLDPSRKDNDKNVFKVVALTNASEQFKTISATLVRLLSSNSPRTNRRLNCRSLVAL